ncbi:MAG: helix-turn-helix domain-containing protein [Planctomycetota bacterium]
MGERIRCESVMVGIFSTQRPRADEVLCSEGLPEEAVLRWLSYGHREDNLFRTALKQGSAAGSGAQGGWAGEFLPQNTQFAYQVIPDAVTEKRLWVVLLGRQDEPFDNDELHALGLLLRQWKSHFNRPKESDMARLLIGHDQRLIHADPHGEQMLLDVNLSVHTLMQELQATVQQRWPNLGDRQFHDVALELADMGWWIRFRMQRALDEENSEYWYVELRPLRDGELAPVGLVEDDRIAQALAFVHDHYAEAPSLNTIAAAVHISPFHFHRLFSKQVDVTPKQYVLQKQIQMAKWLLRTRRIPISQIADLTGFASHGHFTSTFRRFVGASPSEYRQATAE